MKESNDSLEEQGITHMFIDCMDSEKRRRHVQENKDTYRLGIKRRMPRKTLLK